ncbi:MAG: SIR2 family NAD-dependent protein deacylase [Planctomycetota bacterium]
MSTPLSEDTKATLRAALAADGPIVVLTGAGISAESGIPTFRGPEGYWQVGSHNYMPEEMATFRMFRKMPAEVWAWYLYRRSLCRAAAPNPAHHALVELESALGDRFLLITQNVDGLHLRAGNSLARTYQIHGNIDYMRCPTPHGEEIRPMPDELLSWEKGQPLDARAEALLCPDGAWARPHVLWFDESYDEERYRFESSLMAAQRCALLIVVGTSGATNLPMQVGAMVAQRGAPLVAVNPEPSPFTEMAERLERGHFLPATAGAAVPELVAALVSG